MGKHSRMIVMLVNVNPCDSRSASQNLKMLIIVKVRILLDDLFASIIFIYLDTQYMPTSLYIQQKINQITTQLIFV